MQCTFLEVESLSDTLYARRSSGFRRSEESNSILMSGRTVALLVRGCLDIAVCSCRNVFACTRTQMRMWEWARIRHQVEMISRRLFPSKASYVSF